MPYSSSAVSQASGAAGTTLRQTPERDLAVVLFVEVIHGGRAGPAAEAGDRNWLVHAGHVDDDRGHAAEAGVLRQGYVDDDAGGHPGVDRIAACSRMR